MALQVSGAVGPSTVQDGAAPPLRQLKDGTLAVAETHGRYYEAAYRSKLFTAYAGGVATSLSSTTAVGLILVNPPNNGNNLVLQKTAGLIAVTSATTTAILLGLFQQPTTPTGVTAIVPVNNKLGGSAASGAAYSAATIANAPTAFKVLLHNTAAIATTGEDPGWQIDLEGSVIVPPGWGVATIALGAAVSASGMYADLSWEEVPV
jgi:hypothetical protein